MIYNINRSILNNIMQLSDSYLKIIILNMFKKIKDETENFSRELKTEKER